MVYDVFPDGIAYNADCFEVMREMQNKSIDLVLTDPPYIFQSWSSSGGSEICQRSKRKLRELKAANLTSGYDFSRAFCEFDRLCKIPNILVFCSNQQIADTMQWFTSESMNPVLLTWCKTNAIPTRYGHYLSNTEFCIYAHKRNAPFNWNALPLKAYSKVYTGPTVKGTHPNQKPLEFVSNLIQIHSNKGDTILDPFAGSGTTAVAASKLGRKFIVCEKNEAFYKDMVRRIKEETA